MSEPQYKQDASAYSNRDSVVDPTEKAEDYVSSLTAPQIEGQVLHTMLAKDYKRFLARWGFNPAVRGAVDEGMRKMKTISPSLKGKDGVNRATDVLKSLITDERAKIQKENNAGESEI